MSVGKRGPGVRIRLFMWRACWAIVAQPLLRPMPSLRTGAVNLFGGKIHRQVIIYPSTTIAIPWNLTMEKYTAMGDGVVCENEFPVHIGCYAVVSQRARLLANDGGISIEPHAWIMAEASIGPGVTVGEGAVVGARAVAGESLLPWSVYVGEPAKYLRSRDKEGYLETVGERGLPDGTTMKSEHRRTSTQPHLVHRKINFRNRAKRWLWNLLWTLLAKPLPARNSRMRVGLVNLFGGHIHSSVKIDGRARIWAPWNLTAGAGTTIASDVDLYSVDTVEIGKNVSIGAGSFLCTASHDYNDGCLPLLAAPIHIGDHATIGEGSFLAAGVIMGISAETRAGAVVVRNVESGVTVSGNPARPC